MEIPSYEFLETSSGHFLKQIFLKISSANSEEIFKRNSGTFLRNTWICTWKVLGRIVERNANNFSSKILRNSRKVLEKISRTNLREVLSETSAVVLG